MNRLSGKSAVVTGGTRGIGLGIAAALLERGCTVVLCSRKQASVDRAIARLAGRPSRVFGLRSDVAIEADVAELFARVRNELGRLDILVNNAGAFDGGPVEDLSLAGWNTVIGACLTGTFLCTREAFRIMKPQRSGRILNIGSISAQRARLNSSAYTAAKFGVQGLTHATAIEGREFGIAVSCLHPGNVRVERRVDSGLESDNEPMMEVDAIVDAAIAMLSMPDGVNFLDAIVLPNEQLYLGRG